MPRYRVGLIQDALNRDRKSLNGAKILVMGVAYKANIDDMRESPALDVIHLLIGKGAEVEYYDPYVPSFRLDNRLSLLKQIKAFQFPMSNSVRRS